MSPPIKKPGKPGLPSVEWIVLAVALFLFALIIGGVVLGDLGTSDMPE